MSEVRAVNIKDVEKWIADNLTAIISEFNSKEPYSKLETLIAFEILRDLLRTIQGNEPFAMDKNTYKKLLQMTRIKRHYFRVSLDSEYSKEFQLEKNE